MRSPLNSPTGFPPELPGIQGRLLTLSEKCASNFEYVPTATCVTRSGIARLPVDWRPDTLHPRLDLQRHVFRVKTRQRQVAAVEPQCFLRRRLPHVAQFALPGAGVALDTGAEAP